MLLQVEDLQTSFKIEEGVITAVDGVSFSIKPGATLGIVGESGCGKSVTALTIMRLLPTPTAQISKGKVVFEGRDLLQLSPREMQAVRGGDIAMIFQEPMTSLNPVFPIGFQIAEAIQAHRTDLKSSEVRKEVVRFLELVGLSEAKLRYSDYPHQLSGGMRQRVMIAMALSSHPKLLIADEPTTALDVTIQAQILDLIRKLQREMGMATILITHDLGVIAEMVDEVVVMYAGKIVERASVKDLFSQPLHPYTKGLLESMPCQTEILIEGKKRLKAIPGNVPTLLEMPVGCRFQDRCPLATDRCRQKEPELVEKGSQHFVRCSEIFHH